MFEFLANMLPTAANAVVSAVGAKLFAGSEQSRAESWSADEAQRNREFTSNMANTSYQRGMSDMKAAGLNPMLAYSQGGASVPTGSMASYPTGAGASMAGAVTNAVNASTSARQVDVASKQVDATVARIGQEIVNMKTDNERVTALIDNIRAEYQNLIKQGYNLTEVGNQIRATISKLNAEVPAIRTNTFRTELEAQLTALDVEAAKSWGNAGRVTKEIKPFIDLLRSVLRR